MNLSPISPFTPPFYEEAIFKNIPIQFLTEVQAQLTRKKREGHSMLLNVDRICYRFRGPRIQTDNRHTRKQDANRFSVYFYGSR